LNHFLPRGELKCGTYGWKRWHYKLPLPFILTLSPENIANDSETGIWLSHQDWQVPFLQAFSYRRK